MKSSFGDFLLEFREAWVKWRKRDFSLEEAFYYVQGYYRHFFYWRKYGKYFLRRHIREQIYWRLGVMNQECLSNGACVECGERDVLIAMAHFGGNKMDGVARKVLMNRGMSSSQISNVLGSLRLKGIVSGSGKLSELTSFYKLSRDGMGFEISFEVDSQKQ